MKKEIIAALIVIGLVAACGKVQKKTPAPPGGEAGTKEQTNDPNKPTTPASSPPWYFKLTNSEFDSPNYQVGKPSAYFSVSLYAALTNSEPVASITGGLYRVIIASPDEIKNNVPPEKMNQSEKAENVTGLTNPEGAIARIKIQPDKKDPAIIDLAWTKDRFQYGAMKPVELDIFTPLKVEMEKDAKVTDTYKLPEGLEAPPPSFLVKKGASIDSQPKVADLVDTIQINIRKPEVLGVTWSKVPAEDAVKNPNCTLQSVEMVNEQRPVFQITGIASNGGSIDLSKQRSDVEKLPLGKISERAVLICSSVVATKTVGGAPLYAVIHSVTSIPGGIEVISQDPK
jgi:hypothetical protein